MAYERIYRKGTSKERRARTLRIAEEVSCKIEEAEQASKLAYQLGTSDAHILASRAWRRVVSPATNLGLDATIYRDAVRDHIDQVEVIRGYKLDKR